MPKLLVADDSVTIQRVIELTFADEQIEVIAVGDGHQAIQRIEESRPDIVLADVGMPERNGYEVAAFVKRTPYLAHIPVVLLTGAFEPIDEARARAVGCDGVLAKPFEPQMVINRVKDLLAGLRPASLWSDAAPAAPPPAQEAAAAPREEPSSVDSLDEYFDQLDAAFSSQAGPAPAPPARASASDRAETPKSREAEAPRTARSLAVDFGSWDIPGRGPAPAGPADVPAPPPAASVAPAAAQPAATSETSSRRAESASVGPPSLADAFAALLAAEQGQAVAQPGAPRPEPFQSVRIGTASALSDEVIEDIVSRVIARMTDQAVRDTVLSTAERLVREEIERVKKGAP